MTALRQGDILDAVAGESLVANFITLQVSINVLMRDVLDFLRAAATTGQCSPFQPIRILGWAPGWTE